MRSPVPYRLLYALLCAGLVAGCAAAEQGFEEDEDGLGVELGKADSSAGRLLVSEIGGQFVELRNTGPVPVDVDGWYLSFSRRRVRLEAVDGRDSVVEPGGLVVVADAAHIPARVPGWAPVVDTSRDLRGLLDHSRSLILRDRAKRVVDRIDARDYAGLGVSVERRLKTRVAAARFGDSPGARNGIHEAGAIRWQFADPLTQTTNPLPEALAKHIDGADISVDAALYQLDHPVVVAAFVRAAERGVAVRIATDSHYLDDPDYHDGYQRLRDAGVALVGDERYARQHNKFVVVDGRSVWVGSYNPLLQERGAFTAADDALTVVSPQLASAFTEELDEMMRGNFGPSKGRGDGHVSFVDGAKIEVYFSPTDGPIDAIVRELGRAKSNIYFSQFAFYADAAAGVMIDRYRAGVDVRGVLDRRSANSGSSHADLTAAGIDVRRPYYEALLHHKFVIVDYGTADPVVITGSYNLSGKAETQNDESVVVIHDPHVAAAYYRLWSRIYSATHGVNTDTAGLAPVTITEVLAGPGGFVELASLDDAPVRLDGLTLRDRDGESLPLSGVLAPGERMVVSTNGVAFGPGDPLVIFDSRRRPVARFDSPGFFGEGISLERQSLDQRDDEAVWAPSSQLGGTPGW